MGFPNCATELLEGRVATVMQMASCKTRCHCWGGQGGAGITPDRHPALQWRTHSVSLRKPGALLDGREYHVGPGPLQFLGKRGGGGGPGGRAASLAQASCTPFTRYSPSLSLSAGRLCTSSTLLRMELIACKGCSYDGSQVQHGDPRRPVLGTEVERGNQLEQACECWLPILSCKILTVAFRLPCLDPPPPPDLQRC